MSDRAYATRLTELFGANVRSASEVQAAVVLAVQKATSDVTSRQAKSTNLSSDEILTEVTVLSIAFDAATLFVSARVLLKNQSGQGLTVLLPITTAK